MADKHSSSDFDTTYRKKDSLHLHHIYTVSGYVRDMMVQIGSIDAPSDIIEVITCFAAAYTMRLEHDGCRKEVMVSSDIDSYTDVKGFIRYTFGWEEDIWLIWDDGEDMKYIRCQADWQHIRWNREDLMWPVVRRGY